MSKKNFTILGMSYEEYQDMKYEMLARTLEKQEDYDAMLEAEQQKFEDDCYEALSSIGDIEF